MILRLIDIYPVLSRPRLLPHPFLPTTLACANLRVPIKRRTFSDQARACPAGARKKRKEVGGAVAENGPRPVAPPDLHHTYHNTSRNVYYTLHRTDETSVARPISRKVSKGVCLCTPSTNKTTAWAYPSGMAPSSSRFRSPVRLLSPA